MALPKEKAGEYKVPTSKKIGFIISISFLVLTMTGFLSIMINSSDEGAIVGIVVTVIVSLIWLVITWVYTIATEKCENCGIIIRDHKYCNKCELEKEVELRNTTETLYCISCNKEIESVDAYRDHYIKNHDSEVITEGIFRPTWSQIRITDGLYTKKEK